LSALLILAVGAMWLGIGWAIWRGLIRRTIGRPLVRVPALVAFLAVWMIGPWVDEILGAREFERLCSEMPPRRFTGPVAVGPGEFFTEGGLRKWKDENDFGRLWNRDAWKAIFSRRDEHQFLARSPVPVVEDRWQIIERESGRVVYESRARYSPGGWIKRTTGWGSHAPYQCPPRGNAPREDQWLIFKRRPR
jgi:hypothetical protein